MGNIQGKRSSAEDHHGDGGYHHAHHASPPCSPGSPLIYSPQVAMEPISKADDPTGRSAAELVGGWSQPAQPKHVPVVITWTGGGNQVEIQGSFDNWSSKTPLQKSGTDFTILKLLPPGVYQYKYIVDGSWTYDPNLPAMYDEIGNINNLLEVHEYVPENLDSLSGFEPPPSPEASYNNPEPLADDFVKDPPTLPPHLQLTLLNVPPAMDHQAALPRPQHVILNHLYCQRGQSQNVNALVVGTTYRFKSKYVTMIMYKPRIRKRIDSRTPAPSQQPFGSAPPGSSPGHQ